jgi:hypothetical protein
VVALAVQWSPPLASVVATTGRLLMFASVVTATGRLLMVASVVATTGCLPLVASAGPVAGQLPEATNRPGGIPPRASLRKRDVRTMRLRPKRALGIIDLPALPVLNRLPDRPIPGATTLDRRRPLAQLTRPFRLQQLDRAGLGAGAPLVLPHDRLILGHQLRVRLRVRLVVLLLVAGGVFAVGGTVGGTVGGLPGDLVRRLRLLVLLTRAGEVAAAQPLARTMLQAGEQVAGLLPVTGRRGRPLLVLLALVSRWTRSAPGGRPGDAVGYPASS